MGNNNLKTYVLVGIILFAVLFGYIFLIQLGETASIFGEKIAGKSRTTGRVKLVVARNTNLPSR